MALQTGLSWLRYKITAKDRPSTSTVRGSDTAVSGRLSAQSLEAVLVEELEADHRSRVFAWRAIRSIVITEPIDRRSRS